MSGLVGALAGSLGGGGVIGGAVVRLFLDDGQFKTALATAEAEGKTAAGGIGGAVNKMGVLGAAAFAALGTAAIKFGADAVRAALESEKALSELRAQVGDNSQAYEDYAAALQDTTRFSDEAAMGAETILARFSLTEDQIRRTLPVLADYAVATGTTLPDAAGKVGKALLGNARALKTIGINFTATGDAGKDFETILTAINGKVGGAAAADLDTFGGKMENLGNRFDDLKEVIGRALLPVLEEAAHVIEQLLFLIDKANPSTGEAAASASELGRAWQFVRETSGWNVIAKYNDAVLDMIGFNDQGTNALEEVAAASGSVSKGITHAAYSVTRFAGLTGKRLTEWKQETKKTFDESLTSLSSYDKGWAVTAKDIRKEMRGLLREAQTMADDLAKLDDEKWIPDKFKKWLIDQGPEYIHAFEENNRKAKESMVANWKGMQPAVEDVGSAISNIGTTLDTLHNRPPTHHTIVLEYKVAGIDPATLPGLGR